MFLFAALTFGGATILCLVAPFASYFGFRRRQAADQAGLTRMEGSLPTRPVPEPWILLLLAIGLFFIAIGLMVL